MHVAARLEDRLNTVVGGWLTGRGWVPRVEPYTGYGAPGWVRVMARAVLAPPGTSAREVAETDLGSADRAVRGWRGFFTAKVPFGTVQVRIGGRTDEHGLVPQWAGSQAADAAQAPGRAARPAVGPRR